MKKFLNGGLNIKQELNRALMPSGSTVSQRIDEDSDREGTFPASRTES
jgi:hypothetical protein